MNLREHRKRLNKIKGGRNENIFTVAWGMVCLWYWRRRTLCADTMVKNEAGRNAEEKISIRNYAVSLHTAEKIKSVHDFQKMEDFFQKHWKEFLL